MRGEKHERVIITTLYCCSILLVILCLYTLFLLEKELAENERLTDTVALLYSQNKQKEEKINLLVYNNNKLNKLLENEIEKNKILNKKISNLKYNLSICNWNLNDALKTVSLYKENYCEHNLAEIYKLMLDVSNKEYNAYNYNCIDFTNDLVKRLQKIGYDAEPYFTIVNCSSGIFVEPYCSMFNGRHMITKLTLYIESTNAFIIHPSLYKIYGIS